MASRPVAKAANMALSWSGGLRHGAGNLTVSADGKSVTRGTNGDSTIRTAQAIPKGATCFSMRTSGAI